MKPTLLVLAAGMGSRYGGLKQLDGVGPSGETIMEFSIYDAIKAGFGKVVFVIRRSFEDAFKEKFGNKFDQKIEFYFYNVDFDFIIFISGSFYIFSISNYPYTSLLLPVTKQKSSQFLGLWSLFV